MTNFLGWISALAHTHARPLAAVAVREGVTRVKAIDAVQEAFVTLLSMPQGRELSLDEEGAARLMAVLVRNASRNMRRRRRRSLVHESLDGSLRRVTPSSYHQRGPDGHAAAMRCESSVTCW